VYWLPGEPPGAFRVSATRLNGYDVTGVNFDLHPVEERVEPIYLRGRATVARLELEVGGTSPDWKRKILLDRYTDFMARLTAVNQRADQYWASVRE
jgi:hypothetical protein